MKKASAYAENLDLLFVPIGQLGTETAVTKEDAIKAIKDAQKDAIEHTLKVAAEKVMMIRSIEGYDDDLIGLHEIIAYDVYYKDGRVAVDKSSILSLKDELFKELEDETNS